MKRFFWFILPLLLLFSCITIHFTEPQPYGGERLEEIPAELCGTWRDKDDQFSIDPKGMTEIKVNKNEESGTIDSIATRVVLSDTFRIYRSGKLYVVNYRESNYPWEIAVAQKMSNGDINIYQTTDAELLAKDKNLRLLEAHFILDGKDTIVRIVNPDFEGNREFKKATFEGQMKHITLKKIAKKTSLQFTLSHDGKIY